MSLFAAIFIALFVLKLAHVTDVSWLVVVLPLVGEVVLDLIILAAVAVFGNKTRRRVGKF